jgi:hypothetical protein
MNALDGCFSVAMLSTKGDSVEIDFMAHRKTPPGPHRRASSFVQFHRQQAIGETE